MLKVFILAAAAAFATSTASVRGAGGREAQTLDATGGASVAVDTAAQARFGTLCGKKLGQDCEHSRITVRALACTAPSAVSDCYDPNAIALLAGREPGSGVTEVGSFGAVGTPDNPSAGLLASDDAHCDNGDFLAGFAPYNGSNPFQTQQKAKDKLNGCRTQMKKLMASAVTEAGKLWKAGNLDPTQFPPLGTDCDCYRTRNYGITTAPRITWGKCSVLCTFGELLHASEDFYSHSNWADGADLAKPLGVTNPPGLGNANKCPWLNLRKTNPAFPVGLMSGCFALGLSASSWTGLGASGDGGACKGRVTHFTLNKDKGSITSTGLVPSAEASRGLTVGPDRLTNFARAVTAATDDTRDKWEMLKERIREKYVTTGQAAKMICAIAKDVDSTNIGTKCP